MISWPDWFIYYYNTPLTRGQVYNDFTGHEEDTQRAFAVRWLSIVKDDKGNKKLHEITAWKQLLNAQRARGWWRGFVQKAQMPARALGVRICELGS